VLLECLSALLEVDGTDRVPSDAVHTARGILSTVSQQSVRDAFIASFCSKFPRDAALIAEIIRP
jgi:hypothetical protein